MKTSRARPKGRRPRGGRFKLMSVEAKLSQAYAFLETILENIPDMIFVKDALELRFVRFNRAGEELLGMDRKALLGKSDYDLFPKEQADFFTTTDRAVLKSGAMLDVPEEPIVAAKGRRLLHTKKVPVKGLDGSPAFLLGISEDITDLVVTRRKLAHRTQELEAAIKELESFSYSVAHDLRAPLRAIEGFTAFVRRGAAKKLDAPSRKALERVSAAARRMGALIDALLVLARLSRRPIQSGRVDLAALARASFARLQAQDPRRRAVFRCPPAAFARGDPALLGAALDNLLGNAWKFTSREKRARIEFGVANSGGETTYFVRDNGVGYDMAYQSKLFQPFSRLHESFEFPGTGIGLATVHRVIQRHGGKLWSEARVGRGATFFFTLPR